MIRITFCGNLLGKSLYKSWLDLIKIFVWMLVYAWDCGCDDLYVCSKWGKMWPKW